MFTKHLLCARLSAAVLRYANGKASLPSGSPQISVVGSYVKIGYVMSKVIEEEISHSVPGM